MRLQNPLIRLPVGFCPETLAAEVNALPASAWTPHPNGFPGNEAVRLVTPEGRDTDGVQGAMAPTPHLLACSYIMEIMAELGAVWGRSRLMGLGPGAKVPAHVDINYYWRTHIRIHIPITTNPGVRFTCDGQTIHMAAGECWVLDTFRSHNVVNEGSQRRVHLVLDTVGGERLWDLVHAGTSAGSDSQATRMFMPGTREGEPLAFEQSNSPEIMSPWEIRCHISDLIAQTSADRALDQVIARLDRFTTGWAAAWARYGTSEDGLATYNDLIATARADLQQIDAEHLVLANGRALYFVLDALVFGNAIASSRAQRPHAFLAAAGARRRMAT